MSITNIFKALYFNRNEERLDQLNFVSGRYLETNTQFLCNINIPVWIAGQFSDRQRGDLGNGGAFYTMENVSTEEDLRIMLTQKALFLVSKIF